MRFDRELTLLLSRLQRGPATHGLPILMYHSISYDSEAQIKPYYRVTTSPRRFSEQMQWLKELGYRGAALEDTLDAKRGGRNDARLVAITFDDGFRNFLTSAWPVLQHFDFTATMYLPTAFISAARKSWLGRECLTWDEVRQLCREGVRFGSHTVNHPKLYQMSWGEIEKELM